MIARLASLVLAAAVTLFAAAPARALTTADATLVGQAEAYLNKVATLKAHFVQIAPDGASSEGTLYLDRPGKLRLDYDPPSPVLVVADGGSLVYYDKQLGQVSYVDLDSTLAGVLVKPQVQLDAGQLKVTNVVHHPGLVEVTITRRDDSHQGQITLIFTEAPFQLRQWRVLDAQGTTTQVSLYDAQTGIALDPALFQFHDPRPRSGESRQQ